MENKYLVPIDGSESSLRALDEAMRLGEKAQAEIFILSVVPEVYLVDQVPNAYVYSEASDDGVLNMTKKILETAKERAAGYPYPVNTNYVIGNVSKEILSFADANNISLIVMGNRGLGAFSRTFLGSISNKVINGSKVSVLVVKHKE